MNSTVYSTLRDMQVVLSPFRILLIFLTTAFFGVLGGLLLLFQMNADRVVYITMNKGWSPLVLWFSGVKLKFEGLENLDRSTPAIYVANHSSHLDTPVIGAVLPFPTYFIAKKSLAKVPFLGWYGRAVGMIFIDRSNREKAMTTMKHAARMIKGGKNVLSFPEGTRCKTGEIGMFRRGSFIIALEEDLPVVPMAITGSFDRLPSGSWIIRPGRVHVKIGPPILRSRKDTPPEIFAADTQQVIRSMMA